MGLHSPFGYVNYEVQFAEIMVKLLDDLCGGCHTNDDYGKGCHQCPAGQLIYECRDYLLSTDEPDKHYGEYASDEWQARRKERYGHTDSPDEIESWRKLSEACKPEGIAIRVIKREVKRIEPHPFFHSQWIFEDKRAPDPLLKLREAIKDLDYIVNNRFNDWRFHGRLETTFKKFMRKQFYTARQRLEDKEAKDTVKRKDKQ